MSEKTIVNKVSEEVKKQSIETLKVREETLKYLRQNGFRIIEDIGEDGEGAGKRVGGKSRLYSGLHFNENLLQ